MTIVWDVVDPADNGILEDLEKRAIRDGEKRLMVAMIESATEDFQKYVLARDRRGREHFLAAEEWFLDIDSLSFFSFENICQHLQIDAAYLRKGLMRWKEAALRSGLQKYPRKSSHRAA